MAAIKENQLLSRAEALAIRSEATSETELIQRADELLTRSKETIKAFSKSGREILSLIDLSTENQAKRLKQMESALFLRAQTLSLADDIHDFFNSNKAELRRAYGHDKNNGKFLIILRFLGEKLPKLFQEQETAESLLNTSMRAFAANNPDKTDLIGVDFDIVDEMENNSPTLDTIRKIEAPRTLMTLAVMIVFLLLSTSRVSASKEATLDNELIDFSEEETRDAIAAALSLFGQTVANIEDLGTTTDFITTMENYIADVTNGNFNFDLQSDLFSGGGGNIETGDDEEDPSAEEISVVPQFDGRNSWQLTINANEGLVILSNEMITELLSGTGLSGEEVLITYNEDTQEIEFRLRVEDGNEFDGTNYDADQAPVAIIAAADLQELMPENSRLFMVNENNVGDLQEVVSFSESETETQPQMIVTPINNATNVRITASTGNTEVVGQVDSDTQLVVLDIVEDGQPVSGNPVWYQISWTDDEGIEHTGYIADQVVNIQEQPEIDAEAAPTPDENDAATEPAPTEEIRTIRQGNTEFTVTASPEIESLVAVNSNNVPQELFDTLTTQGYSILTVEGRYYLVLPSGLAAQFFFLNNSETTVVTYGEDQEVAFSWIVEENRETEGAFATLESGIYSYDDLIGFGLDSINIDALNNSPNYSYEYLVVDEWNLKISEYDIPYLEIQINGTTYDIYFSYESGVYDNAVLFNLDENGQELESSEDNTIKLTDISGERIIIPVPYSSSNTNNNNRNDGITARIVTSVFIVNSAENTQLIMGD